MGSIKPLFSSRFNSAGNAVYSYLKDCGLGDNPAINSFGYPEASLVPLPYGSACVRWCDALECAGMHGILHEGDICKGPNDCELSLQLTLSLLYVI